MPVDSSNRSFATLTHARVRAEQGDVAGALRVLRTLLVVEPEHSEALELAERLSGTRAPAWSGAGALRPRADRLRRLAAWHHRIRSRRGEPRVR